jgi:SET domain-containing protein
MSTITKNTDGRALHEPDPLQIHGNVGWTTIEGKGRGVVALKSIGAGRVFERCPVLVMDYAEVSTEKGAELELNNYMFRWGPEDDNRVSDKMAMGIGGHMVLYNHSHDPNADIKQDMRNNLMEFFALRDIAPGEEITIDYDCNIWFDYKA